MDLEEAVEMVNMHNRPKANPIVRVVECMFCGREFARSVNLDQRASSRIVCPRAACQQDSRQERWNESLGRVQRRPRRQEPTRNRLNALRARLEQQIAAKTEELARVQAQLASAGEG